MMIINIHLTNGFYDVGTEIQGWTTLFSLPDY